MGLGVEILVCPILKTGECSGGSHLVRLLISAGVGVVVYTRVASQLVRSTEALATSWELTGVRLLAGMRTDMSGLMLEAMKRSVAKRTLVGPRKVLSVFWIHPMRSHRRGHQAHSGSHSTIGRSVEGLLIRWEGVLRGQGGWRQV